MPAQIVVRGGGYDLCPLMDNADVRGLLGEAGADLEPVGTPLYELASASGWPSSSDSYSLRESGSVNCELEIDFTNRVLLQVITDDQLAMAGAPQPSASEVFATSWTQYGAPLEGVGDQAIFSGDPNRFEVAATKGGAIVYLLRRCRPDCGDPAVSKMVMSAIVANTLATIAGLSGGPTVTMPEWQPQKSMLGSVDLCDVDINLIAAAARATPAELDPAVALVSPAKWDPPFQGCQWTLTTNAGSMMSGQSGSVRLVVHNTGVAADVAQLNYMNDLNTPPTPGLGDGYWLDMTGKSLVVKVGERFLELFRDNASITTDTTDQLTPIAAVLVPKLAAA